MKFSFITLFPDLISGYFEDSILSRAIEKKLLEIDYVNPRDFSSDKWKKVDDTAVGGGAGMVMTPQPLFDTLNQLQEDDVHIIFATPVGKPFNQNDAKRLAKKKHIAFVSGRYEGIDERVIERFADEVYSIGDYILTGGELPSLVMADAISRNVEGVLGNQVSLEEESFEGFLLEAPAFARPPEYENMKAPSEYMNGNRAKISALKLTLSECKTKYFRPNELIKHKRRKNYEK